MVCRFEGCAAPEVSRKLLHVAMGVILCPLPWVFSSPVISNDASLSRNGKCPTSAIELPGVSGMDSTVAVHT